MTNTPSEIIKAMNQERSQLLDLLCEARRLLAGATVHLHALEHYAPHLEVAQESRRDIEAFLERGLFGDKQPKLPIYTLDQMASAGRICPWIGGSVQ